MKGRRGGTGILGERSRRWWLAQAGGGAAGLALGSGLSWPVWAQGLSNSAAASAVVMPLSVVDPGRHLAFPRDFGAHPEARTEWWYLTGWLRRAGETDPAATPAWGFQLTFFRSRTGLGEGSRSAFAPRQLILAHAALTDVRQQRLWHSQQVARAGFGVAQAAEADTDVRLREGWLKRRDGAAAAVATSSAPARAASGQALSSASANSSLYEGQVRTPDFQLRLSARSTQPLMLQGRQGYSRKGASPAQASHYYSQPQLAVTAALQTSSGTAPPLTGRAWLDHEWSESVLAAQAVGWDWIGMNLDDGSALMAFRIRDREGKALWAGGGWRPAGGAMQDLSPHQVSWTPLDHWTSPHTGARYPTHWRLQLAGRSYTVQALVPDQELDARASTGTAYWEGLSALNDAQGRRVGWGYLEMTGYAGSLRL
jgi:predicted secreted hydrolase